VTETPDNAYGKAVLLAERESAISAGERLVADLLSGARISPSVARVDDRIAVIDIVFVATRENYRFRSFGSASGDASLDRYVDPTFA